MDNIIKFPFYHSLRYRQTHRSTAEMGYESVHILVAYLLQATMENHYYPVYHNVGIMYERVRKIKGASYQGDLALLKGILSFVSEIPKFLSKKRRILFSGNMSSDEFLMQLARYSTKEEDMPEYCTTIRKIIV